MTTVVEGLEAATAELHAAAQLLQSLAQQVSDNLDETTTETTTIINNFINAPPVRTIFVDPVDGFDTNPGTSPTAPKKNIDTVIAEMRGNPTEIGLLRDATIRRRHFVYAPFTITGYQLSAQPGGVIRFRRTVSFLGTAENSPILNVGNVCSGVFLEGVAMRTVFIDFAQPEVPAGLEYRSHITATIDAPVSFSNVTITVASAANSGSLLGTFQCRLTATMQAVLGVGAAGHLFLGVASGGNPNSQYTYTSNVTSA